MKKKPRNPAGRKPHNFCFIPSWPTHFFFFPKKKNTLMSSKSVSKDILKGPWCTLQSLSSWCAQSIWPRSATAYSSSKCLDFLPLKPEKNEDVGEKKSGFCTISHSHLILLEVFGCRLAVYCPNNICHQSTARYWAPVSNFFFISL